MRSPIEDANAGAAMNVAPTKKHAKRTATIAKQNNNPNKTDMQNTQVIGSMLGSAIGNFVEGKHKNKVQKKYLEAFNAQGAKVGMSEYRRDQRRTGFTEFIFNGQSPEYQGRLDASARNASTAMYVQEAQYVEEEGGRQTAEEYQKGLYNRIQDYTDENFVEAPDATLAFMKAWQENSNELSRQQIKVREVTKQKEARATVAEGFQQDFSKYKRLVATNPTLAVEWGKRIMAGDNIPKDMKKEAGRSLIIEQVFTSMEAGDISALQLMQDTDLNKSFNSKQISRYQSGLEYLDKNNAYAVTTANNQLEANIDTAVRNGESVQDIFNNHASKIVSIAARNTKTSKHQKTISGAKVYFGKEWDEYSSTRDTERKLQSALQIKKIDARIAEYDFQESVFVDNNVSTLERNRAAKNQLSTILAATQNPEMSLEARTKLMEHATRVMGDITENKSDDVSEQESAIASEANLISSQITLAVLKAKKRDNIPKLAEGTIENLNNMLAESNDPDTKALITNLKINIEKMASGEVKDRLDAESDAEVSIEEADNTEWESRLATILSNIKLSGDERDQQEEDIITNRIEDLMDIQSKLSFESTSKAYQKNINERVNTWRKKLYSSAKAQDKLERKKQAAIEKQRLHKETVDGVATAIKNGSILPTATKDQIDEATDSLLLDHLRTPDMKDMTDEDVIGAAFTNADTVHSLVNFANKFGSSIEDSPLLKKGMSTTFSKMFTPNDNPEQPQEWSDENRAAVGAMQVASNNGLLFSQLSSGDRNKALYFIDAVHAGVNRSDALNIANSDSKSSNNPSELGIFWDGVVPELGLEYANDNLQSHARERYNFLKSRIGHERALDHTKKLVQYQDISTSSMDIKHGGSYGPIKFRTSDSEGKVTEQSTTLKKVVRDFEKFQVTFYPADIDGEKQIDLQSPANLIVTQLAGTGRTAKGNTITSLADIPGGVSVEMIGDDLVFVSNYGTTSLDEKGMSLVAASIHKGKLEREKLERATRRKLSGSQLYDGAEWRENAGREYKEPFF